MRIRLIDMLTGVWKGYHVRRGEKNMRYESTLVTSSEFLIVAACSRTSDGLEQTRGVLRTGECKRTHPSRNRPFILAIRQ